MPSKSSSPSPADPLRLAAQEQLVPGDSLEIKFELLTELGYQGIEVRSQGDFSFRDREHELRQAVRNGVTISSACVDMRHFIGDFDERLRRDARANLASQLGVIAKVGGSGVVSPASYGMFSKRLPPYTPPRSAEADQEIMVEALTELGAIANKEGVSLFLEPLNRYEDHILNSLDEGARLIRASGNTGVALCTDFYHMNIEEADIARSLLDSREQVGHVHLSDTNRHEPGAGHLDWLSALAALRSVGYAGWMVLECRPARGLHECLVRTHETMLRADLAVRPSLGR